MTEKEKSKVPPEWHSQQVNLLKIWGEVAGSYRWMHYKAYFIYKRRNLIFMIPLIIMSTVTGTANFAQDSFPRFIKPSVPAIIGSINLVSAIATTLYQYLKISELMEAHRSSYMACAKMERNISTELNLPVKDRAYSGVEFMKICRNEIDRLVEQSPTIPNEVLADYNKVYGKDTTFAKPDILTISPLTIYEDEETFQGNIVANAAVKFKELIKPKKRSFLTPRDEINKELQEISSSGIVSKYSKGTLNEVVVDSGNNTQPKPTEEIQIVNI
jgi:hypothetical protein